LVGAVRTGGDFAVVNATLVTLGPLSQRVRPSSAIADDDLGVVRDGALVAHGGRIVFAGAQRDCAQALRDARAADPNAFEEIDARGRVLMPGLIDAHTHALYAGDRIADFESIAAGRAPSLGIRFTVERTRECSPQQLVEAGAAHLALAAAHGTTTAEVKTGYALTEDGEAALLLAMRSIDSLAGAPHVVATFCGAHALPPEFDSYDSFVDYLCDRVVPRVASLGIARFADAFCETGYFSVPQSERFLTACEAAGMRLRLHADELAHSGGAKLAAKMRCVAADHLNFIDADDVTALAHAGTIAILCPATTEYLGLARYAPARALIEAGVPVALATDFNPGTSPTPSLQVVAHLARRRLGLTASETIAGVTAIAARSLCLPEPAGTLVEGARADAVLLETPDHREFGYYFGANLVAQTFIAKV
jgi:imidazolonepropionase